MADKKEVSSARTKVDDFLELVDAQKEISLKEAAKRIGVSEEIIGIWAETLEESEKLKIEYKVATPYAISIADKKDNNLPPPPKPSEKAVKKKEDLPPKPLEEARQKPKMHESMKTGVKKIFRKQAEIDKTISELNKMLEKTEDMQSNEFKEDYKKLISLLIENYTHIKNKEYDKLLKNYDTVYKLLTPEMSSYLIHNDPLIKREILDFYSLLVYYKRIDNLRFIEKDDPKRKEELAKIDEIYNKLKSHNEIREALDDIKKMIE